MRRLAVTQTPVKNYQLKLMSKTLNEQITIIIIIDLCTNPNPSSRMRHTMTRKDLIRRKKKKRTTNNSGYSPDRD